MTECSITISCKDERVFKFKFEKSPLHFVNTAKIIKKYALKAELKFLFCLLPDKPK
jgi:hypothetical protein